MAWRIIYVEESEYLSLSLDSVMIHKGGEEITIPLSDIHSLIIDNYKLKLSAHLIIKCSENNINIVVCGVDHMPSNMIIPYNSYYHGARTLRDQIGWSEKSKSLAHKLIIQHKLYNQISLLRHLGKEQTTIDLINDYYLNVKDGDTTNREGLGAKVYFHELFGMKFKRFSEDVLNAGLNYGYSVLRSLVTRAVISKGLHPSLGIFHVGDTNYFNLCDDIIEPFRPLIDHWVYSNLLNEQIFLREHRISLVKLTTSSAYLNNKSQTLFNTLNIYVDGIKAFFDTGDESMIPQPVLDYVKV